MRVPVFPAGWFLCFSLSTGLLALGDLHEQFPSHFHVSAPVTFCCCWLLGTGRVNQGWMLAVSGVGRAQLTGAGSHAGSMWQP